MDRMEKETCMQCEKHCPVDALQCGKGKKYFEGHQQEEGCEGRRRRGEGREGCEGRGRRGEGREGYEGRGRHGEGREGCEGRGRHGEGREGCEGRGKYDEDSLEGLLCRCGYIADRKSGRQRGQKRILRILMESPGISQKELTDKLHIEPGSMSEVLAKLEDKGLIQREKDSDDRRKMRISLTEEGQAAAECHSSSKTAEGMFDVLSEEEKETLKGILRKLLEQWKTERKERGNGGHKK